MIAYFCNLRDLHYRGATVTLDRCRDQHTGLILGTI